jgi:predicted aconitase with swiveling domain
MKSKLILNGKGHSTGIVKAQAVVSRNPFGFWQGIDPKSGKVIDKRHDLVGQSLKGKIFIFPYGRGSTGTPGIFLEAVRNHAAPAAIINLKSEPMIVVCSLLAEEFYKVSIPIIDNLDKNPFEVIHTGDWLIVNGESGTAEIIAKNE